MLRQSSADNNVPPRAPQLNKRAVTPTRGLSLQSRTKLGQHNRSVPFGLGLNTSSSRTPGKKSFGSNSFLAFGAKTPSKTPSKKSPAKKSGKKAALTPSRNCNIDTLAISANFGDRFIAQRNDSQFELVEHVFGSHNLSCNMSGRGAKSAPSSPAKEDEEYASMMRQRLNNGITDTNSSIADISGCRVLAYQKANEARRPPLGFANQQKVLYTTRQAPQSSCQKPSRQIPKAPERILDAPEYTNDYYLNLVDWGRPTLNLVCVALGKQVFLWHASTGEIDVLMELPHGSTDEITSVQFAGAADYCAIGLSTGAVRIFDLNTRQSVRELRTHAERVPSLAWNEAILTSGCATGQVHHCDVRVQQALIAQQDWHAGEVCGLRWSPEGRYLATGGNDNRAAVWAQNALGSSDPMFIINEHQAAVKALAWCPWEPVVLATGGGSADRTVRLTNVQSQMQQGVIDTGSQVCGIVWSDIHRELLCGLGYPATQLNIYKHPQMKLIAELTGHEDRIMSVVASPCGEYVLSAAADETLRLWHCFAYDAKSKEAHANARNTQRTKAITGPLMKTLR